MKQIAKELGISPASVHLWTRDIQITAQHAERNRVEARNRAKGSWIERNRRRRLLYQAEGRERARARDPLHLAGCMLYWAEGAKSRNTVQLVNSDVDLVRLFRQFLAESFSIGSHRFRIRLNFYLGNGLSPDQIAAYWLSALELPSTCLIAHGVDLLPTSSSGTKSNKLPYGVCDMRVHSTRIVQHIFGAIQEYGGFEEPRWLDGSVRSDRRYGGSDPSGQGERRCRLARSLDAAQALSTPMREAP